MEQYKDIPNYNGLYQISTEGKVKSLKSGKILSSSFTNYERVTLSKNGCTEIMLVHRLMAETFLSFDTRSKTHRVSHKDKNRRNNTLDNIVILDNRDIPKRPNTTGYVGVSFIKKYNKYIAQIKVSGKTLGLGRFDCPKEAHQSYLEGRRKYINV